MRHRIAAGLLVTALAATALPASAQDYKVLQRATLGGEGGWDLLTVDSAAQRLYVSRGTRVMVIDADTLKDVGEIPGTAGVHGIAIASELGRGFTSNGRTGSSTIFDLATLEPVGEVKTGENPDMILYEPKSRRVLAFNARSKDVTVIDAKAGTVAGTIALEGQPELAVHDDKGTVFVNLEDKSEVLALDPVALKVKGRWSLAPCEETTGLAIDRAHRRLFAACANKMMAVMDADSGKVVTTLTIGQGPDGAAFDADRQLASAPTARRTVTVIHEMRRTFEVVQTVATFEERAHSRPRSQVPQAVPAGRAVRTTPSPTAEQPRPRLRWCRARSKCSWSAARRAASRPRPAGYKIPVMSSPTPGSRWDVEAYLPAAVLDEITDIRIEHPRWVLKEARQRKRRKTLAPDGRLVLAAVDHPARGVNEIRGDALAMGTATVPGAGPARSLDDPELDGIWPAPDVLEELLHPSHLRTERRRRPSSTAA